MVNIDLSKARECPFCNKHNLQLDSKSERDLDISDKIKYVRKITASIRCKVCHSRGPTASEKIPIDEYSLPQSLVDKTIELWNNR